MAVRSRIDAIKSISVRQGVFVDLAHEAFSDFYSRLGNVAFMLEGWTKASVIRDLTAEKLERFAEIDPGLDFVRRGNAKSIRIDNAFAARFKKLDDRKRARVSRTRASRDFNQNAASQSRLDLQDVPLTNAYLGYVTNENDPLRPSIFFVVNDEFGQHAWEPIELVGGTSQAQLEPLVSQEPEEVKRPSRAKIKKTARKNKKTGSGNG